MSSIIEAEEAKITASKKRIHDERVKEARERLTRLLKNGSDKELGEVCRQLAGFLNPPSAHRKPKQAMPNSTIPNIH